MTNSNKHLEAASDAVLEVYEMVDCGENIFTAYARAAIRAYLESVLNEPDGVAEAIITGLHAFIKQMIANKQEPDFDTWELISVNTAKAAIQHLIDNLGERDGRES